MRVESIRRPIALASALACVVVFVPHCSGEESGRIDAVREMLGERRPHWADPAGGPLCGVFSACTALELSGFSCRPEDYFSFRYVGSQRGSTPEEIEAILREEGAQGTTVAGMSALDLKATGRPVIVNVRSTPSARQYDHWGVVQWTDRGLVFHDGVRVPVVMSVAEFLAIWSGLGVIVSPAGHGPVVELWLVRLSAVLAAGLVLAGLRNRARLWTQCAGRTGRPAPGGVKDLILIGVLTIGMAAAGLGFTDAVRGSRDAVRLATAPYGEPRYETVGLQELRSIVDSGSRLLVDARVPGSLAYGTLPGSINIPVYASLWEIREYLRGVDRDVPLVVFCQSEACGWDEVVGRNLSLLGFDNVAVCDVGWAEYRDAYLKPAAEASGSDADVGAAEGGGNG